MTAAEVKEIIVVTVAMSQYIQNQTDDKKSFAVAYCEDFLPDR